MGKGGQGPGGEGIRLGKNTGSQRGVMSRSTLPGVYTRENLVLLTRFLEDTNSGRVCFLRCLQDGTQKPQAPLRRLLPTWGAGTEVVTPIADAVPVPPQDSWYSLAVPPALHQLI